MPQIPEKVSRLADVVHHVGGRAVLNGGSVRDQLMGSQPYDWDLEIYGIKPEDLKLLIEEFVTDSSRETGHRLNLDAVGEAFTVYKLGKDLDVSLPRREQKLGNGHRGFI